LDETTFRLDDRPTMSPIQEIYRLLAADESRNRMIIVDGCRPSRRRVRPMVLTGRRAHLAFLVGEIQGVARNLIVLRGGMGPRLRRELGAQLAATPRTKNGS
jgi:hypothetical protein